MQEGSPLKVLFVLGWGRSGSTILDNVLGELGGFFSAGELRYLWERGVVFGWRCGCGAPVRLCPLWSRVLRETGFNPDDPRDPQSYNVYRWQDRHLRSRHTPALLRRAPSGRASVSATAPAAMTTRVSSLDDYVRTMGRVYQAVARATGARVVVDSSKRPPDAAALLGVPGVEPYVIQLVRDPRAVAYSWGKSKPGLSERRGACYSTATWTAWNLAGEAVRRRLGPARSMLLQYEDFVADPAGAVVRIARLVGEEPPGEAAGAGGGETAMSLLRRGVVRLRTNHTVSGNPSRFETGQVELRADERWLAGMTLSARATATLLALPLLRRYGYRLWPRASQPAPTQPLAAGMGGAAEAAPTRVAPVR